MRQISSVAMLHLVPEKEAGAAQLKQEHTEVAPEIWPSSGWKRATYDTLERTKLLTPRSLLQDRTNTQKRRKSVDVPSALSKVDVSENEVYEANPLQNLDERF